MSRGPLGATPMCAPPWVSHMHAPTLWSAWGRSALRRLHGCRFRLCRARIEPQTGLVEFKEISPGRPRLDLAIRIVLAVSVLILAVAAVIERDLRGGAAVVVIASFGAKETLVLPDRVTRALGVVTAIGIVAWLASLAL